MISAKANANIALIKYWGKRDSTLMLPTKSSLSVGLDALITETKIKFSDLDNILINGQSVQDEAKIKVLRFLHLFRKKYGISSCFQIDSTNNFPTAAGLASSASGFAALAKALNILCNLNLDTKELSILARLGSGSACRSIQGGFCLWNKGIMADGSDSYAQQLFTANHWPELKIIVAVVQAKQKLISSTEAMQITVKTCRTYQDWLCNSEKRIKPMIKAIENKDLEGVGQLAQADCLDMHEAMRASHPAINYWTDKTIKIMGLVDKLRQSGIPCYFTIDAGPNVKILTLEKYQNEIENQLNNTAGIQQIIVSGVASDPS